MAPPRGNEQKKKKVAPKEEGIARRDGTVSFLDEDYAKKETKKQRKVQIDAQRAANLRVGKQRRARIPGMRSEKDA